MTHQEPSSTETAPRFDRWGRLSILTIMASVVGLWGVGLLEGIPCIFQDCTGLPCPFCGGTRAFAALAGGRLAESLSWHPLVIPGAVLAALMAGTFAAETIRSREYVAMAWWNKACGTWVAFVLAFGVLRCIGTAAIRMG